MRKKQVPEWWHLPMLPIGLVMAWLSFTLGCQHLTVVLCVCAAIIHGGAAYCLCVHSSKFCKDTVSWFVVWNTYGILACMTAGFMLAVLYLGDHL